MPRGASVAPWPSPPFTTKGTSGRAGCSDACRTAVEVAQRIEEAGASCLTVHGRVAAEFFQGKADWDAIAAVKRHAAAMGPDKSSGMPAPFYFRQSTASDLGAMAKRTGAKHLLLTHLIPPVGAERQGAYIVPGGPLTEADYRKAAESGGFTGNIVVGSDLAGVRLPAK